LKLRRSCALSLLIVPNTLLRKEQIVTHLVKKFPDFYVNQGTLLYSQNPVTGSCTKPDEYNP